jgi:beta-phosphoglucomutase-like phosphatase (HAD superfamily)
MEITMKEAIIVDLDGCMTDVTLVEDVVTGIFPIYSTLELDDEGESVESVIIGYRVATRPQEGLYKLWFDLDTETWGEGMTAEELDAIQNAPMLPTAEERIVSLEDENIKLMLALTQVYEEKEADKAALKQESIDNMLAMTELYELIIVGGN